jgi:hypothetical protein
MESNLTLEQQFHICTLQRIAKDATREQLEEHVLWVYEQYFLQQNSYRALCKKKWGFEPAGEAAPPKQAKRRIVLDGPCDPGRPRDADDNDEVDHAIDNCRMDADGVCSILDSEQCNECPLRPFRG